MRLPIQIICQRLPHFGEVYLPYLEVYVSKLTRDILHFASIVDNFFKFKKKFFFTYFNLDVMAITYPRHLGYALHI